MNLQLSNISAIIESTQVADATLISLFGKSCAWQVWPSATVGEAGVWRCVGEEQLAASTSSSPFGDDWVLSLGCLLVLLMTVPLGYYNIDDIVWVQMVACLMLTCLIVPAWLREFGLLGLHFERLPAVGSSANVAAMVGPTLFNYAYIITVPSWVNESKRSVSINKSMWWSLLAGMCTFLALGWVGAAAMKGTKAEEQDLLACLTGPRISSLGRAATFLFPWAALVSGIPVFSIIVRYNLIENKLCSRRWAIWWATLFPWLAALLFYAGNLLETLLNWVSLLSTVPLNLVLPCYLYTVACGMHGELADGANSSARNTSCMDEVEGESAAGVHTLEEEAVAMGESSAMDIETPLYRALPKWFGRENSAKLAVAIAVLASAGNTVVFATQADRLLTGSNVGVLPHK